MPEEYHKTTHGAAIDIVIMVVDGAKKMWLPFVIKIYNGPCDATITAGRSISSTKLNTLSNLI